MFSIGSMLSTGLDVVAWWVLATIATGVGLLVLGPPGREGGDALGSPRSAVRAALWVGLALLTAAAGLIDLLQPSVPAIAVVVGTALLAAAVAGHVLSRRRWGYVFDTWMVTAQIDEFGWPIATGPGGRAMRWLFLLTALVSCALLSMSFRSGIARTEPDVLTLLPFAPTITSLSAVAYVLGWGELGLRLTSLRRDQRRSAGTVLVAVGVIAMLLTSVGDVPVAMSAVFLLGCIVVAQILDGGSWRGAGRAEALAALGAAAVSVGATLWGLVGFCVVLLIVWFRPPRELN